MPRREDVERGKCGLCWLSSTASHIQACVGGRTLVSCGKTIPVSLPIQIMWKCGPSTEFCWQRDGIGAWWKFLCFSCILRRSCVVQRWKRPKEGIVPPCSALGWPHLKPWGLFGVPKPARAAGAFGQHRMGCWGVILVDPLPLRTFQNSKRDFNSHPALPTNNFLFLDEADELWAPTADYKSKIWSGFPPKI